METTTKSNTGLAARYAAALYELAFERNTLDQVVEEMAAIGRLLSESPDLARLIRNRAADSAKAGAAFAQSLAAQGVSDLVRNFIGVAVANRRFADLPALIAGFATYTAAKRGETVAEIASAHPLSDLQRNQLRARLTESGYGKVRLAETVDPELLGGLTLKIGAKLYDTSLKSRLERIRYSLKGAA